MTPPEVKETRHSDDEEPETPMEKALNAEKPKSVLWLIILMFCLFLYGVYDVTMATEENGCAMTYMYEYPLFIKIKGVTEELSKKYPRYRLLVYGESEDYLRSIGDNIFTGIPVLFIPGNAGSFKQVRSMASVALRKAYEEDVRFKYHFDYFTLDYNEEYSALYGGTLEEQTQFAAESIEKILGLYQRLEEHERPKSVVIIGHSIGGLIAKSLFMLPNFDEKMVNTIITLATPHEPVVTLDGYSKDFYDNIDAHWNQTRNTSLRSITLVSVGGGDRDIQVRSGLTISKYADVNVVSTGSPGTWVSADHRCIAWCKQLMLSLNRALFDSVDMKTNQISENSKLRRKIFDYHLLSRNAGKKYKGKGRFPATMTFDREGVWNDPIKRQFSFQRQETERDTHLMVKIIGDPKHEMVTIDATNIGWDSWIFACKAMDVYNNVKYCKIGDNLSSQSAILPSNGKRKTVTLNLSELGKEKGYTHVLIYIPKGSENVKVIADVYNQSDRQLSYDMPRWITFWRAFTILDKTAPNALFYKLNLNLLDLPWQAYDISVLPVGKCDQIDHYGLMKMVTPWANDARQSLIGFNMTNTLTAKLQNVKPVDLNTSNQPAMIIYLNPSCQYKIEIRSAIGQMWGQIIRFYGPILLPMTIAVVLLTLVQQIKEFEKEGYFPMFHGVITTKVTPISVVLPSRLLGSLLSASALVSFIPQNDYQKLAGQGVDFAVLPIIMFFVSIGIVTVISFAAWMTVVLFGTLANKAMTKFVASYTATNETMSDIIITGVSKIPFILSGLLIALGSATCGSLAMCLGTFCHFIHLFHLYEDYLKQLLKSVAISQDQEKMEEKKKNLLSATNFQFTIGLLWAFATVFNVPSLMAWISLMPFSSKLDPDPSLPLAIVMSTCLAATWGEGRPRKAKYYSVLSIILQFVCIIMVLFGCVSLFRINHFLVLAFIALGLHQIISPSESNSSKTDQPQTNDQDESSHSKKD